MRRSSAGCERRASWGRQQARCRKRWRQAPPVILGLAVAISVGFAVIAGSVLRGRQGAALFVCAVPAIPAAVGVARFERGSSDGPRVVVDGDGKTTSSRQLDPQEANIVLVVDRFAPWRAVAAAIRATLARRAREEGPTLVVHARAPRHAHAPRHATPRLASFRGASAQSAASGNEPSTALESALVKVLIRLSSMLPLMESLDCAENFTPGF